jgi:hypothetical protein
MKKSLLLFSIAIGCLSARSQVTFSSSSSSSVSSGTTVTLNSSGETTNAYLSNVASVTTNNSNVTATLVNTVYGFSMPNYVTQVEVTLSYPSGTGPVPVTLTVHCTLFDGSDFSESIAATPTFNVSPATTTTTTYWNVAEPGTFEKQGCGSGTMGSLVTYIVPAHTYSSTSSVAAANQLAINVVNANGQNYANANGTCTAVYAKLVGDYQANHFTTHVIIHFYSDPSFNTPFTLPSGITVNLTWVKYANSGTPPTNNATENFVSTYTIPAGVSALDLGHMSFYATNPPGNSGPFSDIAQSVILQTDNPNFTTGANTGVFD